MMKFKFIIAIFLCFLIFFIPIAHALEVKLVYDDNGNLITGDGKFREYNDFNQLVKVRAGFNNVSRVLEEYTYHPTEDRILAKKVYDFDQNWVETIIYVDDNLVRKINASGTYDIVYVKDENGIVAELTEGSNKLFYHNDHLRSTTLVTDENGNVVENTFYEPYGDILEGGNISRFDYEGKEFSSETQDYDFNFRKYDPNLIMFTKPDNLLYNIYDPQSLNRYAFERNNPYQYVDPTGHQPQSPTAVILEEASKITASYLYGLERKRIEENKRYEKLYELYRAENPELPSDPYIKVLVSAGGGKTAIEKHRRMSLGTLESWNSGKLQQYANQPAAMYPGDQLPISPPKVSTPLDSGSGSSSGSSSGGILNNIWNWLTRGGNDDSSSSSSSSAGEDSSDSSSNGGGSSGGSDPWWCFWCRWF